MERVAFDLRRPSFVAFDEHARCDAANRHRRRVEERPARHKAFGLTHVRQNFFRRLPRARRDAGERDRRAHQFEERPPSHGIGDRLDLGGKFVGESILERRIARELVQRSPEIPRIPNLEFRIPVLHR